MTLIGEVIDLIDCPYLIDKDESNKTNTGLWAQPNREDSPLTRKIRMLENRLDKAMIKYNEAQSIRKTYEQIVKRLKVTQQATRVNDEKIR